MREVVQHKIGGVLLVAESAAAQTREEWALLLGAVALAMMVIGIVDWIGKRSER